MGDKEIILLFIILPATLLTAAIFYLRSRKFLISRNEMYSFSFFSKRIALSKHDLIALGVLLLCFSWLNLFCSVSVSLFIVLCLSFTFPFASFKRIETTSNKETTQQLLDKLSAIEKELVLTKQQFIILQTDLTQTQMEVEERQRIKEELDATILEKKATADTWNSMNDEQRNLVSQTAVTAISKKMKGDFWQGMIWGFIINILATLSWTLLGNPGKDELLRKFNSLIQLVKGL